MISPHLLEANLENCKYKASICSSKNGSYQLRYNYIPYKIKWYENGVLAKIDTHSHSDSFHVMINNQNKPLLPNDLWSDTMIYSASGLGTNILYQVYDSFFYFQVRIINPQSAVLLKRRQLYRDSLNTHLATITRYQNSGGIFGDHLIRTYKKDSLIYHMIFDKTFRHLLVQKFYDSARDKSSLDDTVIYYDPTLSTQYGYMGGCIDFKTNTAYTLKLNTNWNGNTASGDNTVYIEKIDLTSHTRTSLFSFPSAAFQFTRVSGGFIYYIDLNRLYLYNQKLYIRNCHLHLVEYDLKTNTWQYLPLQFQMLPITNYGHFFSELFVDPFGYMYFFNNLKLQQQSLVDHTTKYICQESIQPSSTGSYNVASNLDADCSGNFFFWNNGRYLKAGARIVDTFSSFIKSVQALVYFWNGDSILLNYTESHTTFDTAVCTSYRNKNKVYLESGTYYDTISKGCYDSIITLKLRIYPKYNDTLRKTSCDSFSYRGTSYNNSGVYTSSYISVYGCDSLHTLDLKLYPSKISTQSQFSCTPYVWQDSIYSQSGSYIRKYKTIHQCDSILKLDLSIGLNNKLKIENGINYTSLQDNVSYQWYRCNPWRRITNETKKTFTTKTKGSYAVVLDNGKGCRDTSDCLELYSSQVPGVSGHQAWTVFPNPFKELFHISLDRTYKTIHVKLYDLMGRLVVTETMQHNSEFRIKNSELPKGSYYLQVETETSSQFFNLLKE